MYGILELEIVEAILLLMVGEGIISLENCDAMIERFHQFPPGTTLDTVVDELRREVEDTGE
jgi:hypothetical protein